MNIDRATKEELRALSKEIFGSPNRYTKFLEGIYETVTREVTEEVPAEIETRKNEDGTETQVEVKPAETRKVKVPVLINPNPLDAKNPNGHSYKTLKRYSVDEVRAMLLDMKTQLDAFKAKMQLQQDEARAKEAHAKAQAAAEAKVREAAQGSAHS